MTPGVTSVLSVICPWLHGDSHLLEQKAMGPKASWKMIKLAQDFIEILLTSNAGYRLEKKDGTFLLVPKHVIFKLKNLYHQLKRSSSQVQGSAGLA